MFRVVGMVPSGRICRYGIIGSLQWGMDFMRACFFLLLAELGVGLTGFIDFNCAFSFAQWRSSHHTAGLYIPHALLTRLRTKLCSLAR